MTVRAWKYTIHGYNGDTVPVYLLDTDVAGNSAWDRGITDSLYGGDQRYRLCQEARAGFWRPGDAAQAGPGH